MSRVPVCLSALLFSCLGLQCEPLARDNPLDPARTDPAESVAILALELPLPKALVRVVHRVVATLEGPGMQAISKELSHPPLGPATGTIGAIPPGLGRTLTIKGYDHDGNLLFTGEQRDLVIAAGDTTRVALDLVFTPLPSVPAASDSSGASPAAGDPIDAASGPSDAAPSASDSASAAAPG